MSPHPADSITPAPSWLVRQTTTMDKEGVHLFGKRLTFPRDEIASSLRATRMRPTPPQDKQPYLFCLAVSHGFDGVLVVGRKLPYSAIPPPSNAPTQCSRACWRVLREYGPDPRQFFCACLHHQRNRSQNPNSHLSYLIYFKVFPFR